MAIKGECCVMRNRFTSRELCFDVDKVHAVLLVEAGS